MAFSSLSWSTGYDVFVSFSGEEIRTTFVSHLYGSLEKRGIRDETENIPKPSEIHLATIRASKIVLVVVSNNYLSSHFLLKEILKFQRSRHLTLFPVYYGVHPWDVRTQDKEFGTQNKIHQDNDPSALSTLLGSKLIQASNSGYMISPDDTARLTDQRVLLVAEGVDKVEQLYILREYIKLSRVIVTCPDQQLLLSCGITLVYQVETLGFYEARQLLNLHAFKHTHPPKAYEQLLSRAIKICNGSPLVIAAVGSELCAKPKQEWETVLSRYERSSDEDTFGAEKSSFGVLNDKDTSLSRNTAFNCAGMDFHMQAVSGLMEIECENEIRIVGIWGVRGVGKMTLARYVYEETMHHFHISVFLENVGKISKDHASLEEAMISKDGCDVTKEKLLIRKVLLIVNGVNNSEQLEDVKKVFAWFGLGSRIIVTTPNRNLLVANGIKRVYEVKCLKVHEALQLFYQYAFKQQTPSTRFKQLSVHAVQLAGRIPLALKLLGSYLCGKSVDDWESVLQKLEIQKDLDEAEVVSIDEEADWKSMVERSERRKDKDKAEVVSVDEDADWKCLVQKFDRQQDEDNPEVVSFAELRIVQDEDKVVVVGKADWESFVQKLERQEDEDKTVVSIDEEAEPESFVKKLEIQEDEDKTVVSISMRKRIGKAKR